VQKMVHKEWTWFTDYVYHTATWTVNAPPHRRLEVGMGIKAFGKPRGERRKFQHYLTFTTVGLGAVHVRVIDGDEPCLVELIQGDAKDVTLYPLPSLPRR